MPSKVIREWLAEYKALPEAELHSYASLVRNNDELRSALYQLFDEDLFQEIVDPVCHQLFEFYRTGLVELQRLTLELIPTLIQLYLVAVNGTEKKKCLSIEACLLGMYNLEIVNQNGTPKVHQLTIPTLAVPSIYHEPPSLASIALTESALIRYHSEEPIIISVGPLPQVENINSQQRFSVLTVIMRLYNADIGSMTSRSHQSMCEMCSRLTKAGFESATAQDDESETFYDSTSYESVQKSGQGVQCVEEQRISLNSSFLVEVLSGLYYVLFHSETEAALQALDDLHDRATYELYSQVLLVTNAIKNSLEQNPSSQSQDGPMGISIALSPTAHNPMFAKRAITNASFRAKKLPDDIEAIDDGGEETKPPHYDDIMDQDRAKTEVVVEKSKSGAKITKPLKSIMRKTQEKSKLNRKESDSKKRDSVEHSPRPSGSGTVTPSSSMNGEIADPKKIRVTLIHQTSRSDSEPLEMRSLTSADFQEVRNRDSQHQRSSSFPDEPVNYGNPIVGEGTINGQHGELEQGSEENASTQL